MHRWILQSGEDWYRCFEAKDGTFFIFQSATNTARPDECRLVSSGHRSAERALERLGSRLDGIRPRRQPVGGREVVGEVLWNEFWGKFGGPPQGSYDVPGHVLGVTDHGAPQIGLGRAPEASQEIQVGVGTNLRNRQGDITTLVRLTTGHYPDGIVRFDVLHSFSNHMGVWCLPDILADLRAGMLTIVTEP